MSGGVPKRISISRTQSNTPSKAGNVMAKKAIVLCNGARSRRAMCNSVQTRAKYCPTPCKTSPGCQEGPAISFTGATVSTIPGFTVLTFNSNGTFTVPPNFGKDIEYLVVGGGGSGGVGKTTNVVADTVTMGGGGGGAVKSGTIPASLLSSITTPFTVTVGAGSPGLYTVALGEYQNNIPYLSPSGWGTQTEPPLAPPDATSSIINNSASSFTSISARPGFNGGITFLDPSGTAPPGAATTALATRGGSSGIINPGLPITLGNPGANGATSFAPNKFYAPGGGGGGGAGATPAQPGNFGVGSGGDGGIGIGSTITGTPKYYGGGGGGAGKSNASDGGVQDGGSGGFGGGGRGVGRQDGFDAVNIGRLSGAGVTIPAAVNGTPNTGGGGGGVSLVNNAVFIDAFNSGAGGSGVVILRYVNDC